MSGFMFDLPHVASRLFGTPLMIGRAKLEVILGTLAPRLMGGPTTPIAPATAPKPLVSMAPEGVAVVSVVGTLVGRSGYLDAASGLLSYGDVGDEIAGAMADPAARGVILDVDSPGGEVGGLFDLIDRIRALRAASDKPLWAVANESALSAAYAVASAAERLYVTRTGVVGSIGVVVVHVDQSGADTKAGLAWSFLFAGERKIDGNAHAPLSERARADLQADVDRLHDEFCALVAANRGLTPEAARASEAAVYRGALAIRAGLADRIGTLDGAIADMAQKIGAQETRRAPVAPLPAIVNPVRKRSLSMTTDAAPVDPNPDPAEPDPAPQPDPAEALRAEYAEIADIAAQAGRLGVAIDAADAMRKGVRPEALRRSVLDALAARSEASAVIAAVPTAPAASESPIVRRALERAAANRK